MPTRGYVSVGVPEDLARLIDEFLASERYRRRNRNQFVVDAVRHYLPVARREEEEFLQSVRR